MVEGTDDLQSLITNTRLAEWKQWDRSFARLSSDARQRLDEPVGVEEQRVRSGGEVSEGEVGVQGNDVADPAPRLHTYTGTQWIPRADESVSDRDVIVETNRSVS